ncbi:MAG: helix-turn-helix domain-containing protein, partial [Raoultibacter sp.]
RDRFDIASTAPLRRWIAIYRKGGQEALKPKAKGRPRAVAYEDASSDEFVQERNRLREENKQLLRKLRG